MKVSGLKLSGGKVIYISSVLRMMVMQGVQLGIWEVVSWDFCDCLVFGVVCLFGVVIGGSVVKKGIFGSGMFCSL